MQSANEFLSKLRRLNVHVWAEGDRLRYRATKGSLTPDLLTQLREHKTDILAFLNHAEGGSQLASATIQPIPRGETLPLSFAQQRLWFLHQLDGANTTYHMIRAFRLQGQLQVSSLEQAIKTIIARHEILRTTFQMVDGTPVQMIAPRLPFSLPVVDVRDLPEAVHPEEALRQLIDAQLHPFDLAEGPLFRVLLIRLDAEAHLLLVVMHHIISDDWSVQVFLKEVSALYCAELTGTPASLLELAIQYADYAHWQRQWLTADVIHPRLDYWRQQLAGTPPLIDLPSDRSRTSTQPFQAGLAPVCLRANMERQLKTLSQQSGATLFMTLLAAFVTLLSRYSAQDDIVIGTGVANREPVATEPLIGCFVNTVALRVQLQDRPTFRDLLARVREVALEAYDHSDVPFDHLVEALQPERHLSHSPLCQAMFILQTVPKEELKLPGLTTSLMELDKPTAGAAFDITLSLQETGAGLKGALEYNANLFDAATIERMATHFQTLLAGIVANPEQPVSYLPLLTDAERRQLLGRWPATPAAYSDTRCIHQMFEAQVEKSPNTIAAVCDGERLTYRELNERANQLAHYLQGLGTGPEALVGICVERSLDMMVGLLGILKAGGAYVPLDPSYPQERLAYMVHDAQLQVVVTQSGLIDALPPCEQPVCLDTDWGMIAQHCQKNLVSRVDVTNLAYVMYTSGSTGQPKGVMVSHQNVVRLFTATEPWFHFNAHDVWTLFHSYAFDFSVWEMWGALLYGGRLVIVPYWISRDSRAFYNLLISERVTVLNQTPSAFYQLINVDEHAGLSTKLTLRLVIFGGEVLDLPNLTPWFHRHGDQYPKLVNMYGITETTVHVTYRPLTAQDVHATGSFIGDPIPDLQIYLLDQYQEPVPIGVRGEIYVGGAGVTRGYLNRPDLTFERFRSNPFDQSHGYSQAQTLYKTGDIARYLANGELVYVGRIDHQVKIRGFRIELGEIEAVLSQYQAVRECVVLVRDDESNHKQLVAYIVPDQQQAAPVLKFVHMRDQGKLADEALYELPNGMVIAHLNKTETEFLYQEIFTDKSYLQHGITIQAGDCIFDVGANIGLFTLFAAQTCPDIEVYAFEPIPPVFDQLCLNAELYDLKAKLFQIGLSNETKQDTFTYFPNVSVISGHFADAIEEKEVVKSFLFKQHEVDRTGTTISNETVDELLTDRLQSEQFTCQLKTLSDVIEENRVEQIDLLKIDVEKSERDVLAGIQEKDWPKIKQIVVEVHDINDRFTEITKLLQDHGYELTIVQDPLLKKTPRYNIYAQQSSVKPHVAQVTDTEASIVSPKPVTWRSLNSLINDIRHHLQEKLPEYMTPAAFVVRESFPLTPQGKIDRQALPPPNLTVRTGKPYETPRTDVEQQIMAVWQNVLRVDEIGIHDNFFELGGHSLLLAQTHQQLQDIFASDLSIVEMFQYPTIQMLGQRLSQNTDPPSPAAKDHSRTQLRRDRQALLRQQRQRRQQHRAPAGISNEPTEVSHESGRS